MSTKKKAAEAPKIKNVAELRSVSDYLSRIGATIRGMRTAIIELHTGNKYWKDSVIIRFEKNGEVKVRAEDPEQYWPTDAEQLAIEAEMRTVKWPAHNKTSNVPKLPKILENVASDDLFIFRDRENQFVMLQHRIKKEKKTESDKDKRYIPWTYWDDGEWRPMEPDGFLPLWGMEGIGNHTTVFIHEGAKAARYCRWMTEGKTPEARKARETHPWGNELCAGAHVGWIAGALNPERTDWAQLRKIGITKAYIVADNDQPGRAAVQRISHGIDMVAYQVLFSGDWNSGFDLADPFPQEMYGEIDGVAYYKGPSMRDCMYPCTWMTNLIPNPEGGRPTAVLRDHVRDAWIYVDEADLFVCRDMPNIIRNEQQLNKMLASMCSVKEISRLILRTWQDKAIKIAYCPDKEARIVNHNGITSINVHMPSSIVAKQGNAAPWIEYLEYMFEDEEERHQVMRWCATLIARPQVHMEYAMLLISETQGIGKTTLGSHILAPLVGRHNVSFPREEDIVGGTFNGWAAQKRLICVNEIYSGHSWKAYHSLKSLITDRYITLNEKYKSAYVVDNWGHVLANSNSTKALKIENDDRRWFAPRVTEKKWPKKKFDALYQWLSSGGLSIVKYWAETFGDYVSRGEVAPMTDRKRNMIEESHSEAYKEMRALGEALADHKKPAAFVMRNAIEWIKAQQKRPVFESDHEMRKALKGIGVVMPKEQYKVNGRLVRIVANASAMEAIESAKNGEKIQTLVGFLLPPAKLLPNAI